MATDAKLILDLPCDETSGSSVAYDYAQTRNDATVSGADFVQGRQGNCLHFEGGGTAEITKDILDLSFNFTILAWIKPNEYTDGFSGKYVGLFCNTAEVDGSKTILAEADSGSWGFYAVKKAGNVVTFIAGERAVGETTLDGTLTGIALIQDIYGTNYAYADIDAVKVYDKVLSDEEISKEREGLMQLDYYLNGVNLRDYGIRVESSSGILDLPKLKTPTSNDWADYHGKVIDLTDKRFDEREITLNCWIKAKGKMDFAMRVNRLYEVFREDGTQRLMITIHPTKPLVYEVYCEDGVEQSKRWNDEIMIGTFSLKLKEPDPVKRVVRHQKTGTDTATLSIAFKCDKMTNIYWGDGSVDYDVYGDHTGSNAITHTYTDDGVYYAILGGVIEEMTDFDTNGILVWNRL